MSVYRPSYTVELKSGQRLKKVSRTWWYSFTFDGQRIQESSKSTRKTIAKEAEEARRRQLELARNGLPTTKPAGSIRTVSLAMKQYTQAYTVGHREKSIGVVKQRSPHVIRVMGNILVADVTEDRVRDYIRTRQGEGVGGRTINLELLVLSRAIGHTWRELWPRVKKLEENSDIGQALEPEQERALMDAAAKSTSPLLRVFLWLLLWTGMRSDEARTIRWRQIDLLAGRIWVGKKAKTEVGGGREIPISGVLRASLEQHRAWVTSQLGPVHPDWYVFPASDRRRPVDPTKPVTSLKKAWETCRERAGVSCRLHDLRHTFATKLAEAGVPESTMLAIMGHMSRKMLERYSHIRRTAREDAIRAVEERFSFAVAKEVTKVASF
jgi:integrase